MMWGWSCFLARTRSPQVPFILKDRIMEGDGVKMLILTPERDPGSLPCLVGELRYGQEEVGEQAKRLVYPVHEPDFLLGVIPGVPDRPADDAPVLLLHWSVVILPVRAGPFLGDVLVLRVADLGGCS